MTIESGETVTGGMEPRPGSIKPEQTRPTFWDAMPPKVAGAIIKVMGEIPKLEKTEKNTHGNYNFASIDDFLEALRPLCAKHGLIIIQNELSCELKTTQTADGKQAAWLFLTFQYLLTHESGETWSVRPQRTIWVNAKMGSQAFGAAQSYSLKQFARSLFQIATGEADVDTDGGDKRPPPSREAAEDRLAERIVKHTLRDWKPLVDQFGEIVFQTENVDEYAERLIDLLNKAPTIAEVKQLWENNEMQVAQLPANRAGDVLAARDARLAPTETGEAPG